MTTEAPEGAMSKPLSEQLRGATPTLAKLAFNTMLEAGCDDVNGRQREILIGGAFIGTRDMDDLFRPLSEAWETIIAALQEKEKRDAE